ncbi:MAG: 4-alpha-glucanotransferase, partial [Lewinella sp.]|nr:4-alpha-glucanotransferase [Lewinella sp.]
TFRIHYRTSWGQQLILLSNYAELSRLTLQAQDDGWWEGTWVTTAPPAQLHYHYALTAEDGTILEEEFSRDRQLTLNGQSSISCIDSWRSRYHPEAALYNSAFQEVIFRPAERIPSSVAWKEPGQVQVQFALTCVRVAPHLRLAIIGDSPDLGEWQAERALLLGNEQYPVWKTTLNALPGQRLAYKYVLIDPATGEIHHWETGDNRVLEIPHSAELVVRHDEYFAHPGGLWKGAGVAMPVFSLRTEQSCGVGEFTDIKALVDWAVAVDMDMVQILPVNDTMATHTWKDSYPYAAISVFALHPLYLNLDALETYVNKAALTKKRKALNALDTVDYEATLSYKLAYARKVYDRAGKDTLAAADFKAFFRGNQHWLAPYAAFCYFRDQYGTANFNEWPDHRTYEAAAIDKLNDPKDPAYADLAFYYYLQYHLDRQLAGAADYARGRGIVLKGDIPIGIYRYSADAWVEPELYIMAGQAGAPPDAFAAEGQNWGFPTYNWEAMAAD